MIEYCNRSDQLMSKNQIYFNLSIFNKSIQLLLLNRILNYFGTIHNDKIVGVTK